MNRMKVMLLTAAMFSFPALGANALRVPTDSEMHSAQCVAALKANTETLAAQIKAGHEEVRPTLLARLEQGGAFIGNAYLQGERDEAGAKSLLAYAVENQKSLSASELAARQDACSREGAQLLAKASALGRTVVASFAQRRLSKLLQP